MHRQFEHITITMDGRGMCEKSIPPGGEAKEEELSEKIF